MTEDDWIEVFEHTRKRVRQVGLAHIDDVVTMDFPRTASASGDFRRYLSSIKSALSERSRNGVSRAMEIFREAVQTEDEGAVAGINVEFTENDRRIFKHDFLDLESINDYGPLVRELDLLLSDLDQKGVFSE